MEVRVAEMSGAMGFGVVVSTVLTLGLAPLAMLLAMRSWPKQMDERGATTRGGRRIEWRDVTDIVRVITKAHGATTERYDFKSPKGTVTIVPSRLVDGFAVLMYAENCVNPSKPQHEPLSREQAEKMLRENFRNNY